MAMTLRTAARSLCPSYTRPRVPVSSFWSFLNPVWNHVDEERIESVGRERAAAEWLIRCGAKVKWMGRHRYESDYNNLGRITPNDKIIAIDGTDSTICSIGFPYLNGLQRVEEVILQRNPYLDDAALVLLKHLHKSLVSLSLVSCVNITDTGVKSLGCLSGLKRLYLADLMSVKNASECLKSLESDLPDCNIECKLR